MWLSHKRGNMRTLSRSARLAAASALLAALALAVGCSSGPTLYPVSGKVMLANNQPLSSGQITFVPDESKGNKAKFSPTGSIGSDGAYTLTTDGKSGAPLGAYKVAIRTDTPGMGMGMSGTQVDPNPKNPALALQGGSGPKINPKYKDAASSGITKEVVASPSADQYDIKLQ